VKGFRGVSTGVGISAGVVVSVSGGGSMFGEGGCHGVDVGDSGVWVLFGVVNVFKFSVSTVVTGVSCSFFGYVSTGSIGVACS